MEDNTVVVVDYMRELADLRYRVRKASGELPLAVEELFDGGKTAKTLARCATEGLAELIRKALSNEWYELQTGRQTRGSDGEESTRQAG